MADSVGGGDVWLTGLLVLLVLVAGGIYAATRDSSPPPLDRAQVGKIASDAVKKAIEDLQSAPAPSAVAYQQILPSLVEIETERPSDEGDASGLGAGVIVNANGSILTAFHVVEGATSIRVSFVDGTKSTATIASTDPKNDIAVLQPERGARDDRPGGARRRRPGRRRGVRRRAPARLRRLADLRRDLRPRPLGHASRAARSSPA